MRRLLCFLGWHDWRWYNADFVVLKCKYCKKEERCLKN